MRSPRGKRRETERVTNRVEPSRWGERGPGAAARRGRSWRWGGEGGGCTHAEVFDPGVLQCALDLRVLQEGNALRAGAVSTLCAAAPGLAARLARELAVGRAGSGKYAGRAGRKRREERVAHLLDQLRLGCGHGSGAWRSAHHRTPLPLHSLCLLPHLLVSPACISSVLYLTVCLHACQSIGQQPVLLPVLLP